MNQKHQKPVLGWLGGFVKYWALKKPLDSQRLLNISMKDNLNPFFFSLCTSLCSSVIAYRFSSASFYEKGLDEFGILTHIGDVF